VRPHAHALARLFVGRFDPDAPMADAAFTPAVGVALAEVDRCVRDDESRALLHGMAAALRHTLRANVHVDGRWALSLRLQPSLFASVLPPSPHLSNMPYGVFFAVGRHFSGFHVRFSDVARGGLRVVLPPSREAHIAESRRHFMECFGLAWAQQLKNKDIPEGGSKGVCLVTPVEHASEGERRGTLLHACVKRMIDAVLDLLVVSDRVITPSAIDAESRAYTAPPPELLFLGPDENITPKDIDWVVGHAAERGYPMASAFMSSKPRAGINHKEFGVTSEGVAVFLAQALRAVDIEPTRDTFSVKLTGGPDGDVAGNMLKICDRDYGDRARIVGMADGTGCAEDPAGLPMAELLRLFAAGLPLAALDRSALSPSAQLVLADTPAGAARRNSMHNRVVADAFVPAGGRPATIHAGNWRDFLVGGDGTAPSAKVIVEGANLFLTPEARLALFEHSGLPVVKDSSANKCGVICSSMEIVASMALSDDEFVAIKPAYVEQTLARLRHLAALEASLLFAEARSRPGEPLPALSERISRAILRTSNALGGLLDALGEEQRSRLWPLVREQLPEALFEAHASRLPALPWQYQSAMIASGLASRLVYREGLDFCEAISDERLPKFALAYLQQEQVVRRLAQEVAATEAPWARDVEQLLLTGGVRAATEAAALAPPSGGRSS